MKEPKKKLRWEGQADASRTTYPSIDKCWWNRCDRLWWKVHCALLHCSKQWGKKARGWFLWSNQTKRECASIDGQPIMGTHWQMEKNAPTPMNLPKIEALIEMASMASDNTERSVPVESSWDTPVKNQWRADHVKKCCYIIVPFGNLKFRLQFEFAGCSYTTIECHCSIVGHH